MPIVESSFRSAWWLPGPHLPTLWPTFFRQRPALELDRERLELADARLPDCDGLFLGGGFPETHLRQLEANTAMRQAIRRAIESGLPAYAECGGLMYLARTLHWGEQRGDMVGVVPGDIRMHDRPVGRGYVRLQETGRHPWPGQAASAEFPAHEFHYSALENLPGGLDYAYQVHRGTGIDGAHDGLVIHNLLASYSHLRDTSHHHWATRFVQFVRNLRDDSHV
ncbi:MAG TPA: hypothetical protein EYP40_05810 [Chromatiales bacterium]|nr:hypothetical protein [Chromatiales bacterium]